MGQKLSRAQEVLRNKIPLSRDCSNGGRGDRGMGFEEEKDDEECEREEEREDGRISDNTIEKAENRVNQRIENQGLYISYIRVLYLFPTTVIGCIYYLCMWPSLFLPVFCCCLRDYLITSRCSMFMHFDVKQA